MPYIIDSMVCRCDQNRINCPTYPKYERNCVSNDSIYEPRRCDKNNFVQTPQIINNCSCDKNFDSIKCTCPKKQETDKLINCECEPKNKKISSCACIPPKEPIVSCSCTKKSEKIIQRCESHAQTDLKYLDLRIILPSSTGSTQTDEEKINIKILENKGCSPFKTEDITKFKKLDDKGISPIKTEDKTNLKKLEDKGSSPIQIEDKKSPQIKIEEKSPRKDDKIQFPIGVEDKRSSLISVKSDKYDSKSSNNRYKEYIMLEPERPPSQPRTPQSQPTTSQSEPTTPQSQPTTPKKKRRKKSKEKKKKGLFGSKSKAKIETTPAYTMPCIELNSMNNLEQILKLSSIIQSKNEEINRLNSIVCSNQSPFRNLNDQPQTIKIVFEHLPCNSMTQIKEITPASPSHPRQLSKDNSPKKETPI